MKLQVIFALREMGERLEVRYELNQHAWRWSLDTRLALKCRSNCTIKCEDNICIEQRLQSVDKWFDELIVSNSREMLELFWARSKIRRCFFCYACNELILSLTLEKTIWYITFFCFSANTAFMVEHHHKRNSSCVVSSHVVPGSILLRDILVRCFLI